MKKNGLILGAYVLLVLFFIGGIVYLMSFAEPKIAIHAEINSITDADYKRIKERSDPFINLAKEDDFKKIDLDIVYSQPMFIIYNRKIAFEGFSSVLLGNKVIDLSGGYSERNNANEPFASYFESAEVYLNGLSLNEFKDLFKNEKIVISWNKLGTGSEKRVYYLKDLLVVKCSAEHPANPPMEASDAGSHVKPNPRDPVPKIQPQNAPLNNLD